MFLHPLEIVPLYAAALAVLFVILSFNVIRTRLQKKVMFGDAGDPVLEGRVRAHGNFAEFVPFILLLLALAELRGAPGGWLQGLCILLVVVRLSHAYALSSPGSPMAFRAVGALGTQAVLLAAAAVLAFN